MKLLNKVPPRVHVVSCIHGYSRPSPLPSPLYIVYIICYFHLRTAIIKKSVRAIFVYREDPESRAKSAVELQRRVNDKRLWPNVLICPEGTTTNKKVMLKFKLGAFLPKLPVQPILINFKNKLVCVPILALEYNCLQVH